MLQLRGRLKLVICIDFMLEHLIENFLLLIDLIVLAELVYHQLLPLFLKCDLHHWCRSKLVARGPFSYVYLDETKNLVQIVLVEIGIVIQKCVIRGKFCIFCWKDSLGMNDVRVSYISFGI